MFCGVLGENLKWFWYYNDIEIFEGVLKYGNKWFGGDGILIGSFFGFFDSGIY